MVVSWLCSGGIVCVVSMKTSLWYPDDEEGCYFRYREHSGRQFAETDMMERNENA